MPVTKRKRMMFQENVRAEIRACYPVQERRGRFGIELELEGEGFPNQDQTPGWHVHVDNSVRGLEFVTSVPHPMGGVKERIEALNKVFRDQGTQIKASHRASTHIHFNVQREQWIHVLGLIILFTFVEPIFLRLCGDERDGNLFCLPSYDTGEAHFFFERLLEHIHSRDWPRRVPRGKYSSMNTDPIFHQGSVEFRTFPSTTDPDLVVKWCSWIENMMQVVKGQADQTYRTLYLNLKHDPLPLLRLIFGPLELSLEQIRQLTQVGFYQGHELRRLLSHYFKGESWETNNA